MPYTGSLASVIYQLVGGLHQTMFYLGASTIAQVKANGRFVRITSAGLRESHPHDIQMTTEAPNYHSSSAKNRRSSLRNGREQSVDCSRPLLVFKGDRGRCAV